MKPIDNQNLHIVETSIAYSVLQKINTYSMNSDFINVIASSIEKWTKTESKPHGYCQSISDMVL